MLIPSVMTPCDVVPASLSRGMNANSQHEALLEQLQGKSIKRDEC